MHILYLHQYFTTPDIGGGIRSYEFAKRFASDGYKVTMITGNKKGNVDKKIIEEKINGIDVVFLPINYENQMQYNERVKSFINYAYKAFLYGKKVVKPDIIFATSTPLTVALPGILLSKYFKVPLVFEVRDLWPEVPIEMGILKNPLIIKFAELLETYTYKYSKRIIALSPGMVDGIKNRGISEYKIKMIPNMSNVELFNVNNEVSIEEVFYDKYHISKNKKIFSYAGAISTANYVELIIEAAKDLRKRDDIEFVIAGDGKNLADIMNIVKKFDLSNVKLIGSISKSDVVKLYNISTACMVLFKPIPILSTNSPNKLFDALAAGKPVIVNMTGWIANLINQYNAGIPISPDNKKELVNAIVYLADNPEEVIKMGANSRKLALDKFDVNKLYEELKEVFLNVETSKKKFMDFSRQ